MSDKEEQNNIVSGVNSTPPLDTPSPAGNKKIPKNILKFENLISGFSAALIDTPEENLENELRKWLKKFVEFLKVDRCIVDEYLVEKNTIHLLMNYVVPEVENITVVNDFQTSDGVISELEKGVIIKAEKIPEDLPQIFRGGLIEKDKTKSVVIVPLSIGRSVIGSLSFSCYRKERKWSNNLVRRIKLIGELIASTILRIRSHQMLLKEAERRQVMEQRYSMVLENAIVGFWIADFEGNIIDVNDEYCRMSGYSRDELLSRGIGDLDVMPYPERFSTLAKDIDSAGASHHEVTHRKKDGTLMDLDVSTTVLPLPVGQITFSFMRDITELNQARRDKDERLKFEELVSEFSTSVINIPSEDIMKELNSWLKKFVEFLNVDRGIINEHLYEGNKVHLLLNYAVPGIDIPLTYFHEKPKNIGEFFTKGIIVKAEKIPDELPDGLKGGLLEKEKAKSVLIVPLSGANKVIGNLTLINYREGRKWPDDLVRRIRLIGEIIGNALLRKISHETLQKEMEQRDILEKRYSSIIKNANVGFWISDTDQNILVVNDEYCRMSGYSRDELLGMKIKDIDFSDDVDKVERDGQDTKRNVSTHIETRHIRKDRKIIDVEVNSNFLADEGIYFCFIRDTTELNEAKRELEERLRFEELISEFSATLSNVKIDDIKTDLDIWLKRFSDLLNLDRCAIGEYSKDFNIYRFICTYSNPILKPAPRPFPETMPNDGMYGIEPYLLKGEIIKFESPDDNLPDDLKLWKQEVLADGTKSILLLPLISGTILLGRMVISTFTHKRKWSQDLIRKLRLVAEIFANSLMRERSDKELDRYHKHLEIMVSERTAKLEAAQKELYLSEKMATLGRLTATVSHELRNPLGTISSSIFFIKGRIKDQDERVVKALRRAERGINRCDLIIDELLDYSRVKTLNLEQTMIDDWINEVLEENRPPGGITLNMKLESGEKIKMDQEKFRQCIVNIITNAYQAIQEKGNNETGYVDVKTTRENEKIIINISDNGIGFDEEQKSKIFEPLYSSKTYGVGLGMPITKQIIELHGWKMDITGEPQKGASVVVTIPL